MAVSTDKSFDDDWTLQSAASKKKPEPHLKVATIDGSEPLDDQFGVNERKTMPDALYWPLFGRSEPTEAEATAASGDPALVPPVKPMLSLMSLRSRT